MKIQRTQEFHECFRRLPKNIQGQVKKKLALFFNNPHHPSLKTKKMQGFENIWEGRITKNYRFTFQIQGDVYVLRKVGVHDVLKTP